MSRFFSENLKGLEPYVPGEQPQDKSYVKLNTNESPYPPAPGVEEAARMQAAKLNLYSDPSAAPLKKAAAELYGLDASMVSVGNGSDENLAHIFRAFSDSSRGMACPSVSYGFYPVLCSLLGIRYTPVPLREDFSIDVGDYAVIKDNVCIANPNAQTGIYLPPDRVEELIKQSADRIVVVDEAYIDFGGQSAAPLVKKYPNLIVVQTMSKSRSLAGARVGLCFACPGLIADIESVRCSFNPYNVNRMSMFAAVKSLQETDYFYSCVDKIVRVRSFLTRELEKLGFEVLPSKANFVLAKCAKTGGEELYLKLKERGILVRHFSDERIRDYVRISVGTRGQIETLLKAVRQILSQGE